jgi:hypothetical protein
VVCPSNFFQDAKAQLLHGIADGVNAMKGAADQRISDSMGLFGFRFSAGIGRADKSQARQALRQFKSRANGVIARPPPNPLKVKKEGFATVDVGGIFTARFGGREATLEMSPAPRAGG